VRPLQEAIAKGDGALALTLLDSDPSLAFAEDGEGCGPFVWALAAGNPEVAERVLNRLPLEVRPRGQHLGPESHLLSKVWCLPTFACGRLVVDACSRLLMDHCLTCPFLGTAPA
jgi:hypothetical protein